MTGQPPAGGMMTAEEYQELFLSVQKPSKYRNQKTEVDGIMFDSKAEARRYGELKILKSVGAVTDIQLQPRYPLTVNGVKICTYVADFLYLDIRTGKYVTEDVKGMKTALYRLKKKLMKAVYGIDIQEVV